MDRVYLRYLFSGTTWEFGDNDEIVFTNRHGDKYKIQVNVYDDFMPFQIEPLEKGDGTNHDMYPSR